MREVEPLLAKVEPEEKSTLYDALIKQKKYYLFSRWTVARELSTTQATEMSTVIGNIVSNEELLMSFNIRLLLKLSINFNSSLSTETKQALYTLFTTRTNSIIHEQATEIGILFYYIKNDLSNEQKGDFLNRAKQDLNDEKRSAIEFDYEISLQAFNTLKEEEKWPFTSRPRPK